MPHTHLDTFIEDRRIRATVTRIDARTDRLAIDWDRLAKHYAYKIKIGRKSRTGEYSQGGAVPGDPTVHEILVALCSDATTVLDGDRFEDFCDEYGYDTDSIRANNIYKACVACREWLQLALKEDYELCCNLAAKE